ncbi:MAG: hypothetical protein ACI38Y_05325 [Candidatus Methanomethylophilaceae archaeon]
MDGKFILTDLPSDEGFLVTGRTRRCRGCAECISSNMGRCSIDDDLSPALEEALMCKTIDIHTGIADSQFAMPMRKAVERLANILQSFTDAGHNIPLEKDSVSLRGIRIIAHDPIDGAFQSYAEDLLLKGPVERVDFEFRCVN